MSATWPATLEPRGGEYGPVVGRGPAYLMRGAGPGQMIPDAFHAFARREISAVARAEEFHCQDRRELIEMLRTAAGGVIGAAGGWTPGSSLEFLYVTEPRPGQPTRVRLFLTGKALGGDAESAAHDADRVVEHACAALPSGFKHARARSDSRLWEPAPDVEAVELRKQEEVLRPQLRTVPTDYYYVAYPLPGDGSGWPQFGELLARTQARVTVSLLFSPTVLDSAERGAIDLVATQLEFHGRPRQDSDVFGQMEPVPADASAAAALPIWQGYQQHLRHCVLARVTVTGPSHAALAVAKALANAVSAAREPGTGTAPVTQRPRDEESSRRVLHSSCALDVVPWGGHPIWREQDAPWTLRRLPYLYGIEEASTLAILPVPDEHGARGFPLARPSRSGHIRDDQDDGQSVVLGIFRHHGEDTGGHATIPLPAINRHTLVVGAPGSGKTTTVLSLLVRLWRDHGIPFLAIEPTKVEYRSMLNVPGMSDLRVVTLGRDDIAPIRLNPLAPPAGVRREAHVNSVMAVFRAALPLQPPLPQLLEEALERTYDQSGWDYDTTIEDGVPAPTVRDLLETYESGFDAHGYSGDIKQNLLAALRLRLRSLTRGTRGMLLDTVESVDFGELMEKPVVVELDDIADAEDKAILAAFLLDRIRAAARARRSTGGQLRHVTVLEEAHRLLSRTGGGEQESPQTAAIRAFCDAIAELRALGEGFIISSQSPSALAEAAVANTGTRILHRLESSADRSLVLADLDAADVERAAAARLERGEAAVRWPGMDELEFVSVQAADGVDSGRGVTDAEVEERMAIPSAEVRRLIPYRLCTTDMCPGGCDPAIRGRGRQLARQHAAGARRIWEEHQGRVDALGPIAALVAGAGDRNPQLAYCTAVHLWLQGDALTVRKYDIRKRLAAAVTAATGKP
jgi:hypothetical protein